MKVEINLIVLYTITSFFGCIGALMKGSSLGILVGAAFGGMNWIITGLGAGQESISYRVSCIAAKLSPYWCETIMMKKSQPIWRKHGNTQQVGTGITIS